MIAALGPQSLEEAIAICRARMSATADRASPDYFDNEECASLLSPFCPGRTTMLFGGGFLENGRELSRCFATAAIVEPSTSRLVRQDVKPIALVGIGIGALALVGYLALR